MVYVRVKDSICKWNSTEKEKKERNNKTYEPKVKEKENYKEEKVHRTKSEIEWIQVNRGPKLAKYLCTGRMDTPSREPLHVYALFGRDLSFLLVSREKKNDNNKQIHPHCKT